MASIRIVQKLGSSPVNETDGNIIYTGIANTTTNTGLTNGTTYYYSAFAFDQAGNVSTMATASATPLSGFADSPTFTPANGTFKLLVTVTVTTLTPSPTVCLTNEGTDPSCTKASCITGNPYTLPIFLNILTTSTYKGIVCANGYMPSPISQATFTIDNTPPGPPTNLTLIPHDSTIDITWTNPVDSDFNHIKLLRKITSDPINENDGTVIYSGPLQTVTDTGSFSPNTDYHYAAFAADNVGNYSSATTASTTIANGLFAKTVTTTTDTSQFTAVAKDSVGNIYAVGYQVGTSTFDYGNSVTYSGTHTTNNAILVKFDSAGIAQWIRGETAIISGNGRLNGVAVDTSGNIYVVGTINNSATTTFNFNGTTIDNVCIYGSTPFIAKYNSAGTITWVKTLNSSGCNGFGSFDSVAVDSTGNNIYVTGNIYGTPTYNFTGQLAQGSSNSYNALLVKYNTLGNAQWVRTISLGNTDTGFRSVAVDNNGDVYAVGYQNGTAPVKYQGSGSTTTASSTGSNSSIVKYDSSGTFQWAKTINFALSGDSVFQGVTVLDSNIYAVGYQKGTESFKYGTYLIAGTSSGMNAVIVAYNNNFGTDRWVKTTQLPSSLVSDSMYKSVTTDSAGNIYVVGIQNSTDTFGYGSSTPATGTSFGRNPLVVMYNSLGTDKWIKTITAGSVNSEFLGVTIDNNYQLCAVGYQEGSSTYSYSSLNLSGSSTNQNAILVCYQ
ncbi:MAG: hypothetical protein H3C43_00115 [Leptonema sp. (in: Bacteria)]|nr:hypothetical protein [Leptonema sp. (in: bacteria)]